MTERPVVKTAFILGAGLGTRLRPLTEDCPKPLLPLGGRPIITYAMEHLRAAGVGRFIVNTHHRAEAYSRAFPEGTWRGLPVLFRHEPVLLDTAGGLKNIEDLLDEDDETILVYNGDVVSDLPLGRLLDAHFRSRPEATSGTSASTGRDGSAICGGSWEIPGFDSACSPGSTRWSGPSSTAWSPGGSSRWFPSSWR
jgi:NDP-sugar pyrophosphorylase family protein